MNTNQNAWTRKLALVLIICAVVGTEVSYHFTLESRFETIEAKVAQQTASLQAMQETLDTTESSKNETLTGLNKQLASLQSSFEPLGKTSQAQADALGQLHEQLASLQKAQSDQQDAQMKLSAYLAQLESAVKKARAEAAAAAAVKPVTAVAAPLPSPVTNAAAAVPRPVSTPLPSTNAASDLMASPGEISHPVDRATAESIHAEVQPPTAAPRAIPAMNLRPADATASSTNSPGVSPRALPVGTTLSTQP